MKLEPSKNPRLAAVLTLFVLAAWFCNPAALSSDSDVSGDWDVTVKSSEGTGEASLSLRQTGEKITGNYRGRMGESRLTGSISGNKIEFQVVLRFQDMPITVSYRGTVDGDSMSGTVRFGDAGSGTWTARRKKSD